MSNNEAIKARLEDHKGYVYNELHQLMKNNKGLESTLQKFKPSKHRKAYRIKNSFRKRCYAR